MFLLGDAVSWAFFLGVCGAALIVSVGPRVARYVGACLVGLFTVFSFCFRMDEWGLADMIKGLCCSFCVG